MAKHPPKKKIVFLTGTRADFGKIKSLIEVVRHHQNFEPYIFVTGMHLNAKYGMTADEITKQHYPHVFTFVNHTDHDTMDIVLAKTIEGFSRYVKEIKPDLVVFHGDRVEALAAAIVGTLNNILTAHIEGGEVSGTVDEFIRHSVSKMSHIHFVSNQAARQRLIQMGEDGQAIFTIGSPDIDIMLSNTLPDIDFVKEYYDIVFDHYGILIYHPVTTEVDALPEHAGNLVDAVIESDHPYVVIYPNNDNGSEHIFNQYKRLEGLKNFRIFPSTRFEYFIVLLRHADFIVGNSSSGIREAPYFGVPAVNIGSRQKNRALHPEIIHADYSRQEISKGIVKAKKMKRHDVNRQFGEGNSSSLFKQTLESEQLWNLPKQKQFKDLP